MTALRFPQTARKHLSIKSESTARSGATHTAEVSPTVLALSFLLSVHANAGFPTIVRTVLPPSIHERLQIHQLHVQRH